MNGLIAFALKQRVIMVVLFTATLIGGLSAFLRLNIEAYPDPTPPMVDVITQSAGLSAEEIERYITIPIETQTTGLPNLRTIRTISLYGLSDVKLQFNFDFKIGRLRIVVPITLGLIALLLWINFGSLIDTLLTMSVIPMAVIGGLFGLYITDVPFSVSAAIGFIALFGISVMNGIVVLSQYNLLIRGGMDRTQAIVQTGALKIRPVLMTCVIAGVGLLPAAISSGIGSQVQKPLAIVVVSGMTFAPFLIL